MDLRSHKISPVGRGTASAVAQERANYNPQDDLLPFNAAYAGESSQAGHNQVDETILRAAIVGHEVGGINQNLYGKQYGVELLGCAMTRAMNGYAALLK